MTNIPKLRINGVLVKGCEKIEYEVKYRNFTPVPRCYLHSFFEVSLSIWIRRIHYSPIYPLLQNINKIECVHHRISLIKDSWDSLTAYPSFPPVIPSTEDTSESIEYIRIGWIKNEKSD